MVGSVPPLQITLLPVNLRHHVDSARPDIPVTLTGKKMEVPARRILRGARPEEAANRNAMASPASRDAFADYARTQRDYPPRRIAGRPWWSPGAAVNGRSRGGDRAVTGGGRVLVGP